MKSKILSLSCSLVALLNSISFSFAKNVDEANIRDYDEIINAINHYARLIAIFIVVLALGSFIYNIIVIGTSSGNSAKRSEAITNVIVSGGVAAFIPFVGVILEFLMSL